MSNYCQNCYELTEEISKLKAENIHLCEYKDELQAKLEKIKKVIQTCNKLNNCEKCPYYKKCLVIDNSKGDYFNTDKLILDIIEGAEDGKIYN